MNIGKVFRYNKTLLKELGFSEVVVEGPMLEGALDKVKVRTMECKLLALNCFLNKGIRQGIPQWCLHRFLQHAYIIQVRFPPSPPLSPSTFFSITAEIWTRVQITFIVYEKLEKCNSLTFAQISQCSSNGLPAGTSFFVCFAALFATKIQSSIWSLPTVQTFIMPLIINNLFVLLSVYCP